MTLKLSAVSKLAVLLVAVSAVSVGLDSTQGNAQNSPQAKGQKPRTDKDGRPYYGPSGPNVSYQQGPHTRIYVTKRSWLDAGVEVLPGDRKFTDYAFPPAVGVRSFGMENNNRPLDRQPLNPASDMGGYSQSFPLY